MNWLLELLNNKYRGMYTPMQEGLRYSDTPQPFGSNPISNELQRKWQYLQGFKLDQDPWDGKDISSFSQLPQPILLKLLQMDLDKRLNRSLLGNAAGMSQQIFKENKYLEPNGNWNSSGLGRRM